MRSGRTRALAPTVALLTTLAFASVALAQQESTTDETTTETTETTESEETTADPKADRAKLKRLKRQAVRWKRKARHWHRLMGKPRVRIRNRPTFESRLEYRVWLRDAWKKRAVKARKKAKRPPHRRAWRCIHRHEGPWRDPNAPYYGGLQMDLTFQRMYGRRLLRKKGTADHWRPLEQMWVAERALRAGRGFYPWPVAARRCGLI